METPQVSGIFNVGTGKARSFRDLISALFRALGLEPKIEYVDMPENIRGQYQYFTRSQGRSVCFAPATTPASPRWRMASSAT